MSALPPSGQDVPGALPWERRPALGTVAAYVETVKLFISNPDDAWSRARENGGVEDPLLFAIASAVVGSLFRVVYGLMFAPVWMRFIPFAFRHRWMGGWFHRMPGGAGCLLVLWPIATAIGVTVGIFIASAVVHLCLTIVGGLNQSMSQFDGTFRAVSYSSVAALANVVPLCGGLIALVWGFFLTVKGLVRMHRITPGRAAAALLIPLGVVIVLLIGVLAVVFGLFLATRSGTSL